jgi:biotin carboxyl carrier protein
VMRSCTMAKTASAAAQVTTVSARGETTMPEIDYTADVHAHSGGRVYCYVIRVGSQVREGLTP